MKVQSGLIDSSEIIINEFYYFVSLELNSILDQIEQDLKAIRMQTLNLQNQLEKLDIKLGNMNQDLKTTFLNVLLTLMGVAAMSSGA